MTNVRQRMLDKLIEGYGKNTLPEYREPSFEEVLLYLETAFPDYSEKTRKSVANAYFFLFWSDW